MAEQLMQAIEGIASLMAVCVVIAYAPAEIEQYRCAAMAYQKAGFPLSGTIRAGWEYRRPVWKRNWPRFSDELLRGE